MSKDPEWSDWISHDDRGRPKDVEPDMIVRCRMKRDQHVLPPMPATVLDWCFPPDPVEAYQIQIPPPLEAEPVAIETFLPKVPA